MLPKVPSMCNSMLKRVWYCLHSRDDHCFPQEHTKVSWIYQLFPRSTIQKRDMEAKVTDLRLSSYLRHAPQYYFFFPICKMRIMKSDLCTSQAYCMILWFSASSNMMAPCRETFTIWSNLIPLMYSAWYKAGTQKEFPELMKVLWKLYIVIQMLTSIIISHCIPCADGIKPQVRLIHAIEIIHCFSCALNILLAE